MANTEKSYDDVADDYTARFLNELATKPLDRALLDLLATEVGGLGPIADIGCGPGHIARYLHDRGCAVLGVDSSPRMVDRARKIHPGIDFHVGDMRSLGFADQVWGGIVAMYSIIHASPVDMADTFREFRRVLRPGGIFLISFHIGDEVRHITQWLGHAVDLDFHFHERAFVQSVLEDVGLSVTAFIERAPYESEVATTRGYLLGGRDAIKLSGEFRDVVD